MPNQELENSEPMDLSLWIADSKFDGYIENLANRLIYDTSISDSVKKESTITEQLKIIILNLYSVYLKDKKKYVGFSRDKLAYSKIPKRYNKVGLSFKSVGVIDALIEMTLIEFVKGVNYPKLKRTSRIRATELLINEIVKEFKITPSMIQLIRNSPCLIMREKNDDSKNIDKGFKDTKKTNEIRNNLIEYNNLIRRSHIDIPNFPLHGIPQKSGNKFRIDFESDTTKFTRRIFNNDWKSGGRFYGCWWQNIPHKDYPWRKYIRINNKPTIEIDYSGFHVVMLYAKKKIDYWKVINKDAYDLSDYGYVMDKRLRNFLKQLFLTILNSKDFKQAKQSILEQINISKKNEYGWIKKENPKDKAVDNWVRKIIKDFSDYHNPIKRYFYSGVGIKLQYVDSLMAEKIINYYTQLEIPVLCVHDSFIIQSQYGLGDMEIGENGEISLEWNMWCFYQEIIKKEFKSISFPKTKFIECFDRPDSIVKFNKDKITSNYWKRVKNHNKRNYVINWYESESK